MSAEEPVGSAADLIEPFLDRYAAELGVPGGGTRRLLAEAADHLYADTESRVAAGVPPTTAAAQAIAAFGTPGQLVPAARPWSRLISSTWLFTGIGALAVGVSGLLAALFGAIWGWAFVAGDPAGLSYSPQRCAEYLATTPDAGDCRAAALVDHYGEIVDQRILAGMLGLLILAAYWFWRRRGGAAASPLLVGGAAVVSFGLAAAFQLLTAITSQQLDQGQVGGWLAGGLVAAAAALAFLPTLIRAARQTA